MKHKYYNLTEKPNQGIADSAPQWMDELFQKDITAKKEKEKIDLSFKPKSNNKAKCSICGCILSSNEISTCSKCNNSND